MNILNESQLDDIITALNFHDQETDKMEDFALRKYLKYVRVLGYLETETLRGNNSLNTEDLLYSRYFWFNQFKKRYFILFGHDEGLEQQSFKMLSEYNERFPDNIDWTIIERIENNRI